MPSTSPRRERVAQAADGRHAAGLAAEGDREVADLQQRRGGSAPRRVDRPVLDRHRAASCALGRRVERVAQAVADEVHAERGDDQQAAGNKNSHGKVNADCVPSAISVPSETSGRLDAEAEVGQARPRR